FYKAPTDENVQQGRAVKFRRAKVVAETSLSELDTVLQSAVKDVEHGILLDM
ncbi:unnamed protein product, partial [Aphanomyces euteiches]